MPSAYINVQEWNLDLVWSSNQANSNNPTASSQKHFEDQMGSIYQYNEEALTRAGLEDMEIKLVRNRLRWLGHVSWKEVERPVEALLFGELNDGKRSIGRPKIRYKDTCKCALSRWWCHQRLAVKSGQSNGMEKTYLWDM